VFQKSTIKFYTSEFAAVAAEAAAAAAAAAACSKVLQQKMTVSNSILYSSDNTLLIFISQIRIYRGNMNEPF